MSDGGGASTGGRREASRRAAIERYDVLGAPPARDLQALVELAAQVADTPFAAINLVTDDAQHQVATVGFEPGICAREDSMCAAVLAEPTAVVVADATADPRFRDNPFVTGELGDVRFYASAPMITPGGMTVGRLCVFHTEPRPPDPRRLGALAVLAERAMDVLELRLRTRQLEQSLEALTRSQRELQRSNEQLAAFAGQASHDLRNPLTGLLAHVEMLAEQPDIAAGEDAGWMLAGALRSGRRMVRIIDDLLAHAQVGGSLERVDVDLGEVMDAVCEDLALPVQTAGATVIVKDLPVVSGDWAQLYAVLQNLVSNAVKFRRPDVPPVICVTGEQVRDAWRVSVSDNGVGVPAERREEMFELFARGRSKEDGSGIGLATARRLVQAHGGRIELDGSPDGGTLAWFELPR
jgi:signal transduction histidine kinase